MFGKSRFNFALAGIFGLVALVVASTGADAQQVRPSANGGMEVSFWGGCVAYYDNAGRRTDHRSCGQRELEHADAIMASRQQAYGGWNGGWGWNDGGMGQPRIDFNQNGYARVLFPDGCAVTYDNAGRRISHQSCSQNHLTVADRAIASGAGRWSGGGSRWDSGYDGYGGGRPRVFVASNGAGRVVVGGRCTVYYDPSGRRISHEACGQSELQRADRAMYSWRLNSGSGGSAWYYN